VRGELSDDEEKEDEEEDDEEDDEEEEETEQKRRAQISKLIFGSFYFNTPPDPPSRKIQNVHRISVDIRGKTLWKGGAESCAPCHSGGRWESGE
jgi:hypothetical protein